jgi:hypothetical protein
LQVVKYRRVPGVAFISEHTLHQHRDPLLLQKSQRISADVSNVAAGYFRVGADVTSVYMAVRLLILIRFGLVLTVVWLWGCGR